VCEDAIERIKSILGEIEEAQEVLAEAALELGRAKPAATVVEAPRPCSPIRQVPLGALDLSNLA
jgi:hypothetical protein